MAVPDGRNIPVFEGGGGHVSTGAITLAGDIIDASCFPLGQIRGRKKVLRRWPSFVSCRLIDDAGSRALTTDKLVTCHQAGWHGLFQSMDVRFVNTGPQFARSGRR